MKRLWAYALENWRRAVAAEVDKAGTAREKFHVAARCSFSYLEEQGELRELLSKNPDIFTLSSAEDRFYEVNQRGHGHAQTVCSGRG